MKKPIVVIASLFALTASTHLAFAQASISRAQVQAELEEAQRTGDMVGPDGNKLNELYPSQYPAPQQGKAVSREQVLAELAEARRTGDIPGADGILLKDLYPGRYPAR